MKTKYPERLICLTEESVETLYLLGREDLIVGVSAYAVRPKEVKSKPVVSAFTHANLKKVKEMRPDLVLGFSDIQKDIARNLIEQGLDVYIANHRTLEETLRYILTLGSLIGEDKKAKKLVSEFEKNWERVRARKIKNSPTVYFEEWDGPMISGIRWVSELIEACGGRDLFSHKSHASLAKDRFVQAEEVVQGNPDIIFGCWCGKKVNLEEIKGRPQWSGISAVKTDWVKELPPEIFLQPGPALFGDGMNLMAELIESWSKERSG